MGMRICEACGREFQWKRNGPHFYCATCSPPTPAQRMAAWRARPENHERSLVAQRERRKNFPATDDELSHRAATRRASYQRLRAAGRLLSNLISDEKYAAMLAAQNGRCALCGLPERTKANNGSGEIRRLAVDHDHRTGRVRALLCAHCNSAIGHLRDDPNLARAVAAYLDYHAEADPQAALHLVPERVAEFVAKDREAVG